LDILQKVFNKSKVKNIRMSANGAQIRRNGEVPCAVCKHKAKVTMPLKGDGFSPCEGNHHMTWVDFDHKDLKGIFERRLADPKTMLEYEDEVYGGPSPARGKAGRQSKPALSPEEQLKQHEAKAKLLKAEMAQLKKDIKAAKPKPKKSKKAPAKAKPAASPKTANATA